MAKRVARCLFGVPNQEEVTKQMKRDLQEIYDRDARKYNFDFLLGVPIDTGAGDFEFEPVCAEKMPQFYREKRILKKKPAEEIASTSNLNFGGYEKPVTRSASQAALKQTKLTTFMPIRKRKSETNLMRAEVENLKLSQKRGFRPETTVSSPPAKKSAPPRRKSIRIGAGDFLE